MSLNEDGGLGLVSISEFVAIRDDLDRVIADLNKVQERHVLAIKKTEEHARKNDARMESLESRITSLSLEVQALKQSASGNNQDLNASQGALLGRDDRKAPGNPRKAQKDDRPVIVAGPMNVNQGIHCDDKLATHLESATLDDGAKSLTQGQSSAKVMRNPPRDPGGGSVKSPTGRTSALEASQHHSEQGRREGLTEEDTGDETDVEYRVWAFRGEGVPSAALDTPEGPFIRSEIEELLSLGTDALGDIDELAGVKKPRFRVHLYEEFAFVYDPLMLESFPDCAFVSWANPKFNHLLEEYIKGHAIHHGTLYHTFAFPRQSEGWWYLGNLEWQQMDIEALWPRLKGKRRKILTSTLSKSWASGPLRARDFAERLDNKSLAQYTVQIRRPENFERMSRQFIMDVLRTKV